MKKTLFAVLLAAAITPAFAQPPTPPTAPPGPLPVRGVVVFTSGVSYIERAGEVDGDATVPLTFRTGQINDILKSLVLLDEKGRVQPATYAAQDPIGRTLRTFAVDVTQPMGRAELLNRLRGARVAVETDREKITGQIVGVEDRTVVEKDDRTATVQILSLLSEAGLQSVKLDEVKTVRFLDARIDREFREALGVLASGSDDQRRQVTLHFDGDGRRRVRVGYITESPLWKMSYRLVLGGADEGAAENAAAGVKPYLQGWALVENTTDEDWQNIRLSLVSGRPISFIQDLYQPLYLPRPVVRPDIVASPYPQTHGSDLQSAAEEKQVAAADEAAKRQSGPRRPASPAPPAGGAGGAGGFAGGIPVDGAVGRFGITALDADNASVVAQAQGQSAGELFQYNITTPVTLPRQQAAMIPVVAQSIDGEKVSLFNPDTTPRFPLNAVRVKNTTKLHLKGGPVTVFDDGIYAGDAKMEDIPPGDSRLVSYAVDLSVEGERQGQGTSITQTTLALRRGVLTITRRERWETTYTLKSKAEKPRTVLVEQSFNPEFKLVAPAAATERAANVYRFAVTVAPGKSETLKVVTERPISQTLALFDADLNALGVYATRAAVPARIREALQEVIQRRRRVQELQAQAANREAEIKAIGDDQDRIRKNMAALDKASALYKRYVTQLDQQETRIQNLRTEAQRLRNDAAEATQELRAFIDRLDIGE